MCQTTRDILWCPILNFLLCALRRCNNCKKFAQGGALTHHKLDPCVLRNITTCFTISRIQTVPIELHVFVLFKKGFIQDSFKKIFREGKSCALEEDTFTNSIREHFSLGGGGNVGLVGIPPLIVHEIVEPWQPPGVLSDDCPVFLKFRSSTIIILCHGLTNSPHIDCPYLPENIGYQYIG